MEETIGELSEDLRTAVVLRDVQQLPTEEAAEAGRSKRGCTVAAWRCAKRSIATS